MKAGYRATINQPLQGDDVVNFHALRAGSVDRQERGVANPCRGAALNVFSSVMKAGGVMGVIGPSVTPGGINRCLSGFVRGLFLGRNPITVGRVRLVALFAPVVLVIAVAANVLGRLLAVLGIGTRFALVADSRALFVVVAAGFFNAAAWADLGNERLGAALHNADIIAQEGDVKLDELGENREPATPSQAAAATVTAEGVTTRWVSANNNPVHEPPALRGRHSLNCMGTCRSADKEPRDNTVTTIQNRSGELADDVTNNNAILRKLNAKGNVRPFGGGNVILEEIMYTDASTINANSYSGYEVLNITPNSPISAAQFSITQYAAAITMSGLEMLQNSSKEQIIDLMEGRIKVAEAQIRNRLDYDLYQNGTGNSGKNITGLAAAVPDTPTSGTYGGIDRANFAFWQSVSYSGTTNGGAAVSAANIQQYMTALSIRLTRGSDRPDLYVGDNTYFQYYVNSLQAIQRITTEGSGSAGAGYTSLKFYGGGAAADVVLGGGLSGAVSGSVSSSGATSAHMWALNTDYLFLRPHRDRNFVPIGGERQSVNQDAIVKLIGWAGNMTCSNSSLQGVLVA